MQLFHANDFGEWISDHWYSFHIYQKYEKQAYPITNFSTFTLR